MIKKLLIVLIIIIISYIIYRLSIYKKEGFDEDDVIIVIARYNEDLKWLKDKKFKNYKCIIYNKGVNDTFYKPPKSKVIKLKNVGMCDHTYLHHIVTNYDDLNKITIFLPGSADLEYKMTRVNKLLKEIKKRDKAVFLFNDEYNNVQKDLYSFTIDSHTPAHNKNNKLNTTNKLIPASIRPFGKWFQGKFGDTIISHISYYGIFSVSKKDITQKPKSYYVDLLNEINKVKNHEASHYFERSWEAVLYPLKYTDLVEGFSNYSTI
jgi:hypothetical protein